LSASPDGRQSSLSLSIGKDFNRGAWNLSPYLRGVYAHLTLDSFSETADDPNAPGAGLATAVDSRSVNTMTAIAGARVSYTTSFDWGVLVPNAVIEWNHELRNDPQTVITRFVADPTQTPMAITDQAPDENYFNVGIGLNAVLPKGRSGFLLWEHLVGYSGAHDNRYSIGIRIEF
jgi:outer membrane autotransporter protein